MVGTDPSVYCVRYNREWSADVDTSLTTKGQGFRVRSHCAEDLFYACLFPSKSHFPLKLVLSGKSKRFLCHHTWSDLHGGESPPCDSFSVLPSRGKFFAAETVRLFAQLREQRCKSLPVVPEVEYDTVTSD